MEQSSPRLFHQTLLDAAAGHCWIRVDIQWRFVQPSQTDPLYWGPYGATLRKIDAFNAARPKADRVTVLDDVEYAPGWANPAMGSACAGDTHCGPDSAHARDYGTFVADTAHYMLGLKDTPFVIMDWNEANTTYFAPVPSPTIYAAMLCDAFKDVRAFDRGVQLVSSGLAPWGPTGRFMGPAEFLSRTYAAGAKGCFTAIGIHIGQNGVQQIEAVRKVAVAHGDGGLKIELDELAVPTPNPTKIPSKVVQYMTGLITTLGHFSWLGNVLWYGPPGDAGWGIYTSTGVMKPQLVKPILAAERLAAG